VVVLAGSLLLSWFLRKRKRRQRSDLEAPDKPVPMTAVTKDVQLAGQGPAGPSGSPDAYTTPDQAKTAIVEAAVSIPISYGGSSMLWSSPSGHTAGTLSSADVDPLVCNNSISSVRSAAQQQHLQQVQQPAAGAASGRTGSSGVRLGRQNARRNSRRYAQQADNYQIMQGLQGMNSAIMPDSALPPVHVSGSAAGITMVPSAGSGRQDSASTAEPGTPKSSLELQLLAVGPASTNSSSGTGVEDRRNAVFALLKARSDVAVLRDLKIGPLLGRGSYGRVYRGKRLRCPVAGGPKTGSASCVLRPGRWLGAPVPCAYSVVLMA
jgi:hypothetical protein